MLELGIKFLMSYFLGSVMGAIVIGALRGGVDIRTMGSGNAGGTNALRTQGWGFALGVVLIDVSKGWLGAGVIPGLPFPAEDAAVSRELVTYSCAAAVVAGHVWPVYHRFRGGKGAATLVGTLLAVAPAVLIPVLIVWALMLTVFGYVGLATMTAGVTAPLYVALTGWPEAAPLLGYTVFTALFMIYTHRSNVRRMRDGTEPKNKRLMLLHRLRT